MASARNLCQHSELDGTQCTANDYILCPHCQLQLCLKHLNYHQDLLRADFFLLCDQINSVRANLDNLIFDSTNHREYLFAKLDQWYAEQLNFIEKIYHDKKQQLQILCLQAHMEFETYKNKKDKQLKENLSKQLKRVWKQKQIQIEDLNEMRYKLSDIERGLDELKQLLIDINSDQTTRDIQIIKRRYVEAAKTSFNDDDDEENQWDTDDEEENTIKVIETSSSPKEQLLSPDIILLSSPASSCSTTIVKKAPLKFIIKRLKQPPTSTKVKYQLQTVTSSSTLRT